MALDSHANRSRLNSGPSLGWLAIAGSLLLLLVLVRSWENISTPAFYVEDAWAHFTVFYKTNASADKIVDKGWHGYMSVVTYSAAFLIGKLPVWCQNWAYLGIALAVSTIACVAFGATGLFQTRLMTVLGVCTLGLAGFNHFYYWSTLTYQLFTLVILLLTLLYCPPPASKGGYVLRALAISLCVWGGPYSVLAMPVAATLWFMPRFKQNRPLYAWALLNVFVYFLTVDGGTSRLQEVLFVSERYQQGLRTLFEQVYFLGLGGKVSATEVAIFLAALLLVFAGLRQDREHLAISASLFALTVVNLMLYFGSSKFESGDVQANHILISYYFYLGWILITLDRYVLAYSHRRFVQPIAGAALILFIVIDNAAHPEKWRVPVMADVGEFVKAAQFYEDRQSELISTGQYLVLGTVSSWGDENGPRVRIGSRATSARRLKKADVASERWKKFVIE